MAVVVERLLHTERDILSRARAAKTFKKKVIKYGHYKREESKKYEKHKVSITLGETDDVTVKL